ncbi:MAG TPA: 30S ribosomal protein S17 [Nitrospinota bacterium]|nr:30S ribosomal protein S17 [Nitrospinota bacterium]
MKGQCKRKIFEGVVIRNKSDKTFIVNVERKVKHSTFGKIVKRSKKYMVHDEHSKCSTGDKVKIIETRPLSKRKHWRVLEILETAKTKN